MVKVARCTTSLGGRTPREVYPIYTPMCGDTIHPPLINSWVCIPTEYKKQDPTPASCRSGRSSYKPNRHAEDPKKRPARRTPGARLHAFSQPLLVSRAPQAGQRLMSRTSSKTAFEPQTPHGAVSAAAGRSDCKYGTAGALHSNRRK